MKDRVVICETCAEKDSAPVGLAWASQLSTAVDKHGLNMCDTPLSFALQGHKKATYLFSGADPQTDTQDMLGLLKLYNDAPDGWIEDAQKAGRLRLCLRGRVPKL